MRGPAVPSQLRATSMKKEKERGKMRCGREKRERKKSKKRRKQANRIARWLPVKILSLPSLAAHRAPLFRTVLCVCNIDTPQPSATSADTILSDHGCLSPKDKSSVTPIWLTCLPAYTYTRGETEEGCGAWYVATVSPLLKKR